LKFYLATIILLATLLIAGCKQKTPAGGETPPEPPSTGLAPDVPNPEVDIRSAFSVVDVNDKGILRDRLTAGMFYQAYPYDKAKAPLPKDIPWKEVAEVIALESSGKTNEAFAAFVSLESSSKIYLVRSYAQARVAVLDELAGRHEDSLAAYRSFLEHYAATVEQKGWAISRLVLLGQNHGVLTLQELDAMIDKNGTDLSELQPYVRSAHGKWLRAQPQEPERPQNSP